MTRLEYKFTTEEVADIFEQVGFDKSLYSKKLVRYKSGFVSESKIVPLVEKLEINRQQEENIRDISRIIPLVKDYNNKRIPKKHLKEENLLVAGLIFITALFFGGSLYDIHHKSVVAQEKAIRDLIKTQKFISDYFPNYSNKEFIHKNYEKLDGN